MSSINSNSLSRRNFIAKSGMGIMGTCIFPMNFDMHRQHGDALNSMPLYAHLWVYASNYPPNWDCTPVLGNIFSDLSYAGIDGLELMEIILRQDSAVERIKSYTDTYGVSVSGSSYGVGFGMWDKQQHPAILDDLKVILPRLSEVGGKTLGVSVGQAPEMKTGEQLDAQAELLKIIIKRSHDYGITLNFHNHTYEVENSLYDLKETLSRIPDLKLGPDLNWLIRAGVDPIEFIETYGSQIVYLHIRDQYQNGEWTEYVGQGSTNFKGIAEALMRQNFNGAAAIELAYPSGYIPKNELKENWKKSAEFVRSTFT